MDLFKEKNLVLLSILPAQPIVLQPNQGYIWIELTKLDTFLIRRKLFVN